MSTSQQQYFDATEGLESYGILLCGLIKELLADKQIQIHSISYRIKDYESCIRKLATKPERYNSIPELMDLLGVRIITYFSTDVDRVADVIISEFFIDDDNSTDKRKALLPNQFGYLSLHFIASISNSRKDLIEYKRYRQKRFELQVRTILQHAWAEIEHDLGYKAYSSIPEAVKRRFFRLAGSLELADEEFERLRGDISKYESGVKSIIKSKPENLPIDQSTLTSSYENEEVLNKLDKLVIDAGNRIINDKIDPDYLGREAAQLKALGIKNLDELHNYAKAYSRHVELFASKWFARPALNANRANHNPMNRGIGLFYLGYVLVAQRKNTEINDWGIRFLGQRKSILENVRKTWAEVVEEIGKPPKVTVNH